MAGNSASCGGLFRPRFYPMPRTLLVIDDDTSVRESLAYLLSRRGYVALTAESGEVGIRIVREQFVDGVLLDQHMPGMNGLTVCRTLTTWAADRGQCLPIWMMTGVRTRELATAAAAAGADVLLAKPFDFTTLLALLESKLGSAEPAGKQSPPASDRS